MIHQSDAPDDAPPTCRREDCTAAADFWLYRPDGERWCPLCSRHVVHLHPSIELRAWLESGYATPVELNRPEGPPEAPPSGRAAAFRDLLLETMDWSE